MLLRSFWPGLYRSTSELLELAAANAINQGTLSIVLDVDTIERSILFDAVSCLLWLLQEVVACFLIGHYTKPVQQPLLTWKKLAQIHLIPLKLRVVEKQIQELVKSLNQMTGATRWSICNAEALSIAQLTSSERQLRQFLRPLDVFKKKKREQREYDELVDTMGDIHWPPIFHYHWPFGICGDIWS